MSGVDSAVWDDEHYLEWICGYANAEGGSLFVLARAEDGALASFKDPEQLAGDIRQKVRELLGIEVDIRHQSDEAGDYLHIEVASQAFPVSYKGRFYFRRGNSWWSLEGGELDRFLLRKQGKSWDAVPMPGIDAGALSRPAMEDFIERASHCNRLPEDQNRLSMQKALESLHLTDGDYLKRAAVLLFHPEPESQIAGSVVRIGRFDGDGSLLHQDIAGGGLLLQAARTYELLCKKYLSAAIAYDGLQRSERLPVPEEALRECIVNAIVHKDYGSGSPVQIRVHPDRLLLWNPCLSSSDWIGADAGDPHPSRPANPEIARIFFLAGLIESWGSGIGRMFRACSGADFPPPKFRADRGGVWVEFRFAARLSGKEPKTRNRTRGSQKDRIPARKGRPTARMARRILQILEQNPRASRKTMAKEIPQLSEEGVKYHLNQLKKSGTIERIGPSNGGYWKLSLED